MNNASAPLTGKRLRVCSEAAYAVAIIMLSFAVAMISATNFGVSMIVAPAYILSLKVGALTFGQCEYVLQALVFAVFCLLMKKVRAVYFTSFLTCLIYGAVLDAWRFFVPAFNPAITPPGSLALPIKLAFFAIGMALSSLAIALFFKTYIYPQVYDFFVKGISEHFKTDRTKFKRIFDAACLLIASAMSLAFFGRFEGVGPGTIIMTCFNGILIGWFGKMLDQYFDFVPRFPKLAERFELE